MTTDNNNLQSIVPDEEEDILELDADKVTLVGDTFSKVELFLQSNTQRGYVKLNAPGLYSFQLPEHPEGDRESTTHNEDDSPMLTDSWTRESVQEINLIGSEDEEQLGLIQRDQTTGEIYILMPLEIDLLLHPDPSSCCVASEQLAANVAAADSLTAIEDLDEDIDDDIDDEDASQTTLTENPRPKNDLNVEQSAGNALCEREVCNFVVPQMSLKFGLTIQVG